MALVLGVNSYVTVDEAEFYFEDRVDASAWNTANSISKEQAVVSATQQLEQYSYAGTTSKSGQALAFPRQGFFQDPSRGRQVNFDSDYIFVELDTSDSEAFWTALSALPNGIQRLKKATFEQGYHLLNNAGVLDTSQSVDDSNYVSIGSITISGAHVVSAASTVSKTSTLAINFLKPLLLNGGSSRWFRAN